MKYYVYAQKLDYEGLAPDNYLKIDYDIFNMILMAIDKAQSKYRSELKVNIYDDFEKYVIYPVELSYAAINFYDLVYIGEVVYKPLNNHVLPSLMLKVNVDLRADTVKGEGL